MLWLSKNELKLAKRLDVRAEIVQQCFLSSFDEFSLGFPDAIVAKQAMHIRFRGYPSSVGEKMNIPAPFDGLFQGRHIHISH
jgi:hypothetical protein